MPPQRIQNTIPSFVTRRWRAALLAIAVALGAVVVAVLVTWSHDAERNALLKMSPDHRRRLFEETRRNADLICAQARAQPALEGRCIDMARFLLAFPECDESCAAFAHEHRQSATR